MVRVRCVRPGKLGLSMLRPYTTVLTLTVFPVNVLKYLRGFHT